MLMDMNFYGHSDGSALAGLFDILPTGIIMLSDEEKVIYRNRAAGDFLKLFCTEESDNDRIVGETLTFLFTGRDQTRWILPYDDSIWNLNVQPMMERRPEEGYGNRVTWKEDASYYLFTINRSENEDVSHSGKADYRLTTREYEIASLIVAGFTNRDIAEGLFLSVHTVKHHVESLMKKTGNHSRFSAANAVFTVSQ